MLYLYHADAGQSQLHLVGDEHRYLFKVRRHKMKDTLYLRNLKEDSIYTYAINFLDKSSAILELIESKVLAIGATNTLHIGWCVIDPKSVEKVLPTLNEMGVEKITFIYCQRSQKSFKLDFKRLRKILLNSSQQSGRSEMMGLDNCADIRTFLGLYPQSYLLNFSENILSAEIGVESIVVGCEGGLTSEELAHFDASKVIGFDTPLVLKSESAVCGIASKILL